MDNSFVIENIDYLITVNENFEILQNHSLVVEDGKIKLITDELSQLKPFSHFPKYSGKDRIIAPGLINAHTHLPMTLLRGMAEGVDLDGFLKIVWEAESSLMTPENCELGAELGAAESLLGGTTTALDMYFHPSSTHQGAVNVGLRHVTGPIFFDAPLLDGLEWSERIELAKNWPGELKRIGGAFTPLFYMPHSCYTDSFENMSQVAQLAAENNASIHLHLSETLVENKTVAERYQKTPTQQALATGILNLPTTYGHGVHLSESDIETSVKHNAVVAHCPGSNLKLNSGIADIYKYFSSNLTVALGTDSASSSNDLNMWFVLRLAALLISQSHGPDKVDLNKLFAAATRDGAKAVGMEDRIGSIELGKEADLIAIDLTALHLIPNHDVMALLFFAVSKNDVVDVWVNGKAVVSNKKLTQVSEIDIRNRVAKTISGWKK
jgi:5-methylthioadenosine/S-adenosylhomocysteine deaminase